MDSYDADTVVRVNIQSHNDVQVNLNAAIFQRALTNIKILRCENFELTNFTGVNSDVENISFSNLKIRRIEIHYFKKLKQLKYLNVVFNNITNLQNYVFKDLRKLIILNISNNNIQIIETNAFSGLYLLSTLDIHFNSICILDRRTFNILDIVGSDLTKTITNINLHKNELNIIESGSFIFDEMYSIDLSYNRIAIINKNAFDVKSIVYLNLEGNLLSSISRNVFYDLNIEIKLILFNNKIVCDCKLKWIRNHNGMLTQLQKYENKDIRCGKIELSKYIEDMKCYITLASG